MMEICHQKRTHSTMVEDVDNCSDKIEKKPSSVFSSSSSLNSSGTSSSITSTCTTSTTTTEITFLKIQRKVRFNRKVKVVLIPCLRDYKEENIQDLLWWNTEDYELSYKDMITNDLWQISSQYITSSVVHDCWYVFTLHFTHNLVFFIITKVVWNKLLFHSMFYGFITYLLYYLHFMSL